MLQAITPFDALIWGLPGLLIGFVIGYSLGGYKSFRVRDRAMLSIVFGLFGGAIIAFAYAGSGFFTDVGTFEVMLSIFSTFGGIALGAALHWEMPPPPPPKRRVVFELDDDEEFDREIEDAFKSKY
ncbi:MAG: hypothetical protein ACE5H4_02690 [Candidatus Thorarchaeota archaeon]